MIERDITISEEYAQQLFERFCKREQRASLELMHIYGGRLFKYINCCRVFDPDEAKECFQETWIKLIERYCGKPLPGKLWGIMCLLSRNLAVDAYRSRNRQKRSPDEMLAYEDKFEQVEAVVDENPNPERVLELLEETEEASARLHLFKQALMQLPDKQRLALTLKMKEYTLKEIARITGEKEEAVKSQLRIAKDKLQQILAREIKRSVNGGKTP